MSIPSTKVNWHNVKCSDFLRMYDCSDWCSGRRFQTPQKSQQTAPHQFCQARLPKMWKSWDPLSARLRRYQTIGACRFYFEVTLFLHYRNLLRNLWGDIKYFQTSISK